MCISKILTSTATRSCKQMQHITQYNATSPKFDAHAKLVPYPTEFSSIEKIQKEVY